MTEGNPIPDAYEHNPAVAHTINAYGNGGFHCAEHPEPADTIDRHEPGSACGIDGAWWCDGDPSWCEIGDDLIRDSITELGEVLVG